MNLQKTGSSLHYLGFKDILTTYYWTGFVPIGNSSSYSLGNVILLLLKRGESVTTGVDVPSVPVVNPESL